LFGRVDLSQVNACAWGGRKKQIRGNKK